MALLPDTQNYEPRMRRECRERFSSTHLEGNPLVSDPSMRHGTCVAHVPWCMSGLLMPGGGENFPGIPGACAPPNFAYLVRGPCDSIYWDLLFPAASSRYHSIKIHQHSLLLRYFIAPLIGIWIMPIHANTATNILNWFSVGGFQQSASA